MFGANHNEDAPRFFGTRRETDDLGRVTIPAEFRTLLGMQQKQDVAFRGIHVDGVGNGVFIFRTPGKAESGRRLDAVGRVTIPINISRQYQLEKRSLVELLPMCLPEFGHGVFVHKVGQACILDEEQ